VGASKHNTLLWCRVSKCCVLTYPPDIFLIFDITITHNGDEPLKEVLPSLMCWLLYSFYICNCQSILLSTTDKLQRYTIFFIIVNSLHVSGGFSAHHQELKNFTHNIWYVPGLLAAAG